MAAGRALVDAGRKRPHVGHPLVDLLAEQQAAAAGLGSLADHDLDGVGLTQVGGVEAVARGEDLVHQLRRCLALLGRHATVARGGGRAHVGGSPAQGFLGAGREGAEAHAGDGDGDIELNRFGTVTGAERGRGIAALPIALERVPADRGGQEDEVVEGGELAPGAQATDGVAAGVGHLDAPGR